MSWFRRVSTRFLAAARRKSLVKRPISGYVAILLAVTIPVLLLGAKYVVDRGNHDMALLEKAQSASLSKKCAKEAALKVAKKWNPALTLADQKEALLRIADEVYNAAPIHDDSVLGRAIPGLDVTTGISAKQSSSMFGALSISRNKASHSPSLRTVKYEEVKGVLVRVKTYSNEYKLVLPIFQLYDAIYNMEKDPYFALEDACKDVCFALEDATGPYPYITLRTENLPHLKNGEKAKPKTLISSTDDTKYMKRLDPEDNKVQLTVEGDRIKVLTDNDIGYAVPAECNVDIVLAIPTNAAANNINNQDQNSATAGSCYADPSTTQTDDAKETPIYQIAQAYRTFLKDHFLFTRGVNVGLIPYSGNCSLPVDRLNDWTEQPKKFVKEGFANAAACPQRLMGAFLYGTMSKNWPKSSGKLDFQEDSCGLTEHSITNIMCRTGKFAAEPTYGNNILCVGDLLATSDPSGSAGANYSPKFRRKPFVNCHFCHANLLSMSADLDAQEYCFNPFHIVELQSDVSKICDLLSLFYPIKLANNGESNFLFIPLSWADNLFQSWAADPQCVALDTIDIAAGVKGGQLSRPSKTTTGRKKAVILVVNKPDWFEPNELTYIGYNNDFSEIPMVESDKIDFSINYSDTSRKFLYGDAYDGTIAGPRKILKYTTTSGTISRNSASGYYETSASDGKPNGKLSFPEKRLLKVTVEPTVIGCSWTKWPQTTVFASEFSNSKWSAICHDGGKLHAILKESTGTGTILTSVNGVSWTKWPTTAATVADISSSRWLGLSYILGKLYAIECSSGTVIYTSDGGVSWTKWSKTAEEGFGSNGNYHRIYFFGNKYYTIDYSSG
ncbi:MAG: hypothetical protein LBB12_02275, partial [Holosporaceae bacterium]|nr:hypothetical protein [Holosporaceae bacterium]